MRQTELAEIEIREELLENVQHKFKNPNVVNWKDIAPYSGVKEIQILSF